MRQLNFLQLMRVYEDGNIENGREYYPELSEAEQLCNAEQDFYHYLNSVFFLQKNSYYAILESNGQYVSALRLEPYQDGLLLCALETAPTARKSGYATLLISEVLTYLSKFGSGRIYSHVSKNNMSSLHVHKKCGFQIIQDHAVYSDGSVSHSSCTLVVKY